MNDFLESMFSLKGKSAIVTGASRGIGHAVAETLSESGADVLGIARSSAPISPYKNKVRYHPGNINDIKLFGGLCESLNKEFGSIDILVNCAAISLRSEKERSIENFRETIDVNLIATYNLTLLVAGYMKKKRSGSIINIASLASLLGIPDNPGYVASKGGLAMLTRALAIDFAPYNIRVNNIVPGYILTDMTRKSYEDKELKEQRDRRIIKNRWGQPEDLAGAVILLASDASDYMTGSDIIVDGGWSARGL